MKLLHGDCLELMKDIPEEIKRRTDMRDIKFRAWDKVNKKIRKVMSLDFYNTRQSEVTLASDGDIYLRYFEQVELMQYTGLKDKNGVEIYEGDIVAFEDSDGGYEYQDLVINTGIVEYGDLGFYFTNRIAVEMDDFYIKDGRCDDVEVIGNIYENKELIEVECN